MKSYTDLEQSKKLAGILSLESADMYYGYVLPKSNRIIHTPEIGNPIDSLKWYNAGYTFRDKRKPITLSEYCVPCWSLAALLEEIPYEICGDDGNSAYLFMYKENDNYQLVYESASDDFDDIETDVYEDFIDACYEMILKLHELNLL